jgi:ribosomal-protein-alanine N-acetyltransferase
MHIRPATVADIPRMVRLERESAAASHWTRDQYRQAVEHEGPERLVLVAERTIDLEPDRQRSRDSAFDCVGFLVARQLAPDWELENIVVTPRARRRGFGERLLNALFAAAGETTSTAVFLEVRESNAVARTLYERAGFLQTGRRKSYYTDPVEDAILYRRALD